MAESDQIKTGAAKPPLSEERAKRRKAKASAAGGMTAGALAQRSEPPHHESAASTTHPAKAIEGIPTSGMAPSLSEIQSVSEKIAAPALVSPLETPTEPIGATAAMAALGKVRISADKPRAAVLCQAAKPVKTRPPVTAAGPSAACTAAAADTSDTTSGDASLASTANPATVPANSTLSTIQPAFKPVFSIKDIAMDMSANFAGLQDAMTEAQAKAKAAFDKGSSALGEVGEFAKGNVEAVIASGKIFADGVQEIGSSLVSEGRTAFETITGDIKELAAAKSPTDFLKLQSDFMRKSFDSAVAYGSKNSETYLKLLSDSFAPISGRVSLAVEKARAATITPSPVSSSI